MNNRKQPLAPEIEAEITRILTEAGQARRAGDGQKWLALRDRAWDLLPEPKTEWDFHPQTMARGAVETIPGLGLCDQLDVWIDRMYATHFDLARQSEYTNLIAGHALYQCNRKSEAIVLFKHVLAHHGPKWFMGDYRPYLEMAEKS